MSDYDFAAKRNSCGVTHHAGCECHEANHVEEVRALKAQLAEAEAVIDVALRAWNDPNYYIRVRSVAEIYLAKYRAIQT